MMRRSPALLLALLALPVTAHADDEADHLRDALRHVTVDLRAAQDAQTTLQAQLDEANKQKSLIQAQFDALSAKQAAAPPVPVKTAGPSVDQLRAALAQAQGQNAALRGGLSKWQGAYQQAATIARAKDQESRTLGGTSKAASAQVATCEAANTKLTGVANDVLHLYQTQSFRALLLKSYEPLLGFDEVRLENIVQDYEDKIRAQAYIPPSADAGN